MTASADPGARNVAARPDSVREPLGGQGAAAPRSAWQGGWLCRSVPVPPCNPVSLIERLDPSVAIYWSPAVGASFVGLGVAASLRGHGTGALLGPLRDRGTALLQAVGGAANKDSPSGAAPRLLGGFAFDGETESRGAPWQAFGAAQFILPRVLYSFDGDDAWLTLCLTPDDTADGAERGFRLLAAAQHAAQNPANPSPGLVPEVAQQTRVDPARFTSRATQLIESIRCGRAQKVVTAEQVLVAASAPFGDTETLLALDSSALESTRFLFRLGEYSLVGATPERLVSKRGRQLRTEALAGTISASAERAEQALLGSRKDRSEHAWVQEAISNTLSELGCVSRDQQPTRVRRLHNLLHLRAAFTAELPGPLHVLDVAHHLHPTPAVGGVPTDRAKRLIVDSEGFERGWYTGAVGWFDASGDGDFDVALRCGVLQERQAWLYAGAGLVADSEAAQEREEISLKLTTLLSCLRTRA